MRKDVMVWLVAIVASLGLGAPAFSAIEYDQDVTENVIFGSGVANGSFTTSRHVSSTSISGIELGLRAKIRFPTPQNIFLSQGNGTYGPFDPGGPGGDTPNWSFEWSINSNFDGSGQNLDYPSLSYSIQLDFDPSLGTDFLIFDPINGPFDSPPYPDHSIGTNSTDPGDGVEANSFAEYTDLIANNNLAQNSWRMDFFDFPPLFDFDPNVNGVYDFVLAASDEGGIIAETKIRVIVGAVSTVPEISALFTWAALAICVVGFGLRKSIPR